MLFIDGPLISVNAHDFSSMQLIMQSEFGEHESVWLEQYVSGQLVVREALCMLFESAANSMKSCVRVDMVLK